MQRVAPGTTDATPGPRLDTRPRSRQRVVLLPTARRSVFSSNTSPGPSGAHRIAKARTISLAPPTREQAGHDPNPEPPIHRPPTSIQLLVCTFRFRFLNTPPSTGQGTASQRQSGTESTPTSNPPHLSGLGKGTRISWFANPGGWVSYNIF